MGNERPGVTWKLSLEPSADKMAARQRRMPATDWSSFSKSSWDIDGMNGLGTEVDVAVLCNSEGRGGSAVVCELRSDRRCCSISMLTAKFATQNGCITTNVSTINIRRYGSDVKAQPYQRQVSNRKGRSVPQPKKQNKCFEWLLFVESKYDMTTTHL